MKINLKLKKLISVNDLKLLRDLYRDNSPNSTHAFNTLSNFIQWFQQNPKLDQVQVYVLDNWRESGLFFILEHYLLFINVLNYNEKEVAQALKLWDWSRQYKIFALPSFLFSVVEKTLSELNINFRMNTLTIYERPQNFINTKETVKCPDTLVFRSLSLQDAKVINDLWHSRQKGSLEFIEALISYNFSLGLYRKDTDELIAWCTRCQCGFLGTLHVKEEYRRLGLASVLIEEYSKQILERGEDVRTVVDDYNTASRKVFTKLGFENQQDVVIVYNEP